MSGRALTTPAVALPAAFVTLVTISLSWPSEGAIRGDGAVWALLWLVVAACAFGFGRFRQLAPPGWLPKLSIAMLVGGIWLSTWHVFQIGGDRRAALNLAFEWTALGAAWLVTAHMVQSGQQALIGRMLVALSLGAAVLGLLQHHVIYPGRAAWYLEQRLALDEDANQSMAAVARQRAAAAEFERLNIPRAGPQRALFENRLLHSTEPTGHFALTNSLGGQLAVAFVLLVGATLVRPSGANTKANTNTAAYVLAAIAAGLLLYCLILTKSRTAWLGTVAGLGTLFVLHRRRRFSRQMLRICAAALVLMIGLVAFAVQSGALDKEVILEAPRSLQFRWMYWTGTAGVLQETPVVGTGPGNFRQPYLQHKPDAASEEILDPHNVFLDAWVTGGLLAFGGMILLVVTALTSILRPPSDPADNQLSPPPRARVSSPRLAISIAAGLFLSSVWHVAGGGDFPWEANGWLQWQSGLWIVPVVALIVIGLPLPVNLDRRLAAAALAALVVHLLAAGGLQISGLMLLLLMLHATITTVGVQQAEVVAPAKVSGPGRLPRLLLAGMCSVAAVTLMRYVLIPVRQATLSMQQAEYHRSNADPSAARAAFEAARTADPLSIECHQRLVEHLAYMLGRVRLQMGAGENRELQKYRQEMLSAVDRWLQADPDAWQALRFRATANAQFAAADFATDADLKLNERVVADWQRVVWLYPGNSAAWGELSLAAWKNSQNEVATQAARTALRLDKINHEWGHQDRFLPAPTVTRLQQIQATAGHAERREPEPAPPRQ